MPDTRRRCARPGCARPAETTMSFAYRDRRVWIDDLHDVAHPASHDLCRAHADRTTAPRGWELLDQRSWSGPGDVVHLG
ncbi:MAG: DUF3499 family protein [Acidimicrobiales bacterium]